MGLISSSRQDSFRRTEAIGQDEAESLLMRFITGYIKTLHLRDEKHQHVWITFHVLKEQAERRWHRVNLMGIKSPSPEGGPATLGFEGQLSRSRSGARLIEACGPRTQRDLLRFMMHR
ncbi:hypothetical protein DPX16_4204 [Anabarilius grahami]|uniref:Uncharacterized protein n=1 Tax=Anabarilius grahami TaxID=495550 RepID=A0A3N0YRR8_ANAGA|nr:hypothetical protein DPX16_4204 [Anabarilius grahami]